MRAIEITPEECMLVDWVLTMHSYDNSLAEYLQSPRIVDLRRKITVPIIYESSRRLEFTEQELAWLLLAIPITFRFYKEDVGFSLKKKLLGLLIPPKLDFALEVKEDEDINPGENETINSPEDSSRT